MRDNDKVRRPGTTKAKAHQRQVKERQVGGEETGDSADRQAERGFLFEDPYWDDAFCSYYDPTLRTCCRR